MRPINEPNKPDSTAPDIRKDLLKLLILALPTALTNLIVVWLTNKVAIQAGQVLFAVIPMIVLVVILWFIIRGRQQFKLSGFYLYFFLIYILIFSVSSGTNILDGKRSLAGFEDRIPRNFLSLNWAGDWRYWLAKKKPASEDLLIVTMKPPLLQNEGRVRIDLNESRIQIQRMIRIAADNGARGIAFDFYLTDNATSSIDSLLCYEINRNRNKNFPIFFGYGFEQRGDSFVRQNLAENLRGCLPLEETQGHLVGYREWDGKVRMVPIYFLGLTDRDALCLKVARFLDKNSRNRETDTPESGLLQFVAPQRDFPKITYEQLSDPAERSIIKDRFILVGAEPSSDIAETPFGLRPGVVIHSYAIHSLLERQFISRASIWLSFMMVFTSCYLIILLFALRWPSWRILLYGFLISLIICFASGLAMYISLSWIDVIYPLLAIWFLIFILLVLRGLYSGKLNQVNNVTSATAMGDI